MTINVNAASMIQEKLNEIDKLNRERDDLYRELHRSIALAALWPDAFEGSKNPTTQVTGNPRSHMTFSVYNGNTRCAFPLEDVPFILWPEQVRQTIREAGWNARPRYRDVLKENNDG